MKLKLFILVQLLLLYCSIATGTGPSDSIQCGVSTQNGKTYCCKLESRTWESREAGTVPSVAIEMGPVEVLVQHYQVWEASHPDQIHSFTTEKPYVRATELPTRAETSQPIPAPLIPGIDWKSHPNSSERPSESGPRPGLLDLNLPTVVRTGTNWTAELSKAINGIAGTFGPAIAAQIDFANHRAIEEQAYQAQVQETRKTAAHQAEQLRKLNEALSHAHVRTDAQGAKEYKDLVASLTKFYPRPFISPQAEPNPSQTKTPYPPRGDAKILDDLLQPLIEAPPASFELIEKISDLQAVVGAWSKPENELSEYGDYIQKELNRLYVHPSGILKGLPLGRFGER